MFLLETIEDVCRSRPDIIASLVDRLDLDEMAMKDEVGRGDLVEKAKLILAYFMKKTVPKLLNDVFLPFGDSTPSPRLYGLTTFEEFWHMNAKNVLENNTVDFYGMPVTVPEDGDLRWDWMYRGQNDDRECAWFINRHGFMHDLAYVGTKTANGAYLEKMSRLLQDWICQNTPPKTPGEPRDGKQPEYDDLYSPWRNLEASLRASIIWPFLFYNRVAYEPDTELPEGAINDATRLMMLESFWHHGEVLRHFHKGGNNILLMNMAGLLTTAALFPEFKNSREWLEHGWSVLENDIVNVQVYPDGVQKELSCGYHAACAFYTERAFRAVKFAAEHRRDVNLTISEEFKTRTCAMWDYLARITRPDGHCLHNNDGGYDDLRPYIRQASTLYGGDERADLREKSETWTYMIDFGGCGTLPSGPGSQFLEWAGHVILREGWNKRTGWTPHSNWAFFDIGPLGTGHFHRDALHVSIMVHGRPVLVDNGPYWYKQEIYRNLYFTDTIAHNTLTVNGASQIDYKQKNTAPMSPSHVDFGRKVGNNIVDTAWGSYDEGYGMSWTVLSRFSRYNDFIETYWNGEPPTVGHVNHIRLLAYKRPANQAKAEDVDDLVGRGRYWLVIDHVEQDARKLMIDDERVRKINAYWHFHPDVSVHASSACANDVLPEIETRDVHEGNLRIVPFGTTSWRLALVRGRESPVPQGWFSPGYNIKEEATCAVYETDTSRPTTFGWLLYPSVDIPTRPTILPAKQGGEQNPGDNGGRVALPGEFLVVYEMGGKTCEDSWSFSLEHGIPRLELRA